MTNTPWIDCLARGAQLGRSVLMRGHHTEGTLGPAPTPARVSLPFHLPSLCLNRASVGAFNTLYYHRQARRRAPFRSSLGSFFYPLDGLGAWPRLYGRDGFVQYQFVLPEAQAQAGITAVLERLGKGGHPSFLAVLKRFGAGGQGLLSFPMPGFTLALDLPIRPGTLPLLDALDAIVLQHQGRVYLAKDARMSARDLPAMYPRLAEWQTIRRALDPQGRFASALGRRLEMV